ncbi:MAG TPA: type II secretion system F family protein [Candidatus Methylacidiphilales bacterium]|jgi:type IV pilus assembly protein PilC|nr:type II secretion system F family protein [Candidatus Methylacidiphilales bacterium]
MPKFSYTAVDARGKQANGFVEANDQNDAITQIRQLGFYPQRLDPAKAEDSNAGTDSKPRTKKKGGKVKSKILTTFTRQLATLIEAGLPLMRSLNTLAKQERHPVMRSTMMQLASSVESGGTFSEALAQHPGIFDKLYVNMVKAGELGGVLEIVLTRLAEFQEKSQKIKGKVVAAMVYPIVVLVIAVVILSFLLTFIVPQFAKIFVDALGPNHPLPTITLFVMGCSDVLVHKGYLVIGAIAIVVVGYKIIVSFPAGVLLRDQIALRIPIFGDLLSKTAISRFARTLGTLISSGVPILQALNITRDTAGNVVVANAINKVHDSVKEGESVVGPMESSKVFPPMVTSMVQVGEETGQLPDMLVKVADVYEGEVDNVVTALTSVLEPIMIVMLAVIVGTIVIALFMPMISLIVGMSDQGGPGAK